jgi:hypothetical protein
MDNYGLNDTYQYNEICLDSLDSNGVSSNGSSTLDWPTFEIGGKNNVANVAAFKVLSAEIPFSYYVFSSENNSFVITISAIDTVCVIPEGNYNATRLVNQLQELFNGLAVGTFVVQLVDLTQKLKITGPSPFSLTFGTSTDTGNTNPRLFMGFNAGLISCSGVMNAPNCVLLSGPAYLYLNSTKSGGLINLHLPTSAADRGNTGPQLAKIPVNTQSGGIILYSDPAPLYYFDMEDGNLDFVDFYLTMGTLTTQKPLRLNGLSFSIKLGVLTRRMNHDEIQSGTMQQGRVQKRARPY